MAYIAIVELDDTDLFQGDTFWILIFWKERELVQMQKYFKYTWYCVIVLVF